MAWSAFLVRRRFILGRGGVLVQSRFVALDARFRTLSRYMMIDIKRPADFEEKQEALPLTGVPDGPIKGGRKIAFIDGPRAALPPGPETTGPEQEPRDSE